MAEYADREHYIPLRVSDLVDLLCGDKGLPRADAETFRQFCRLVIATYHFEYHQRLQELKDEYAPFDPDAVTRAVKPLSPEEKQKRLDRLFEQFAWLMERANYKRLPEADLKAALEESSDWGINMEVDFNIFEKWAIFIRGDSIGRRTLRKWYRFWSAEEVRVPIYQRLALMVKLKPSKRLPREVDTNDVYLKLFKDIPKVDLEMLLPGARIQMPRLTRWKMGSSMFSGLGWIAYTTVRTLLAATVFTIWALYTPLLALFGYGYKQWAGYQFAKTAYGLQLAQSLYYQNLDNNEGVLNHLLDEAEEQECREAILAYYYMWRFPRTEGWTAANLDDYVEMDLERLAGLKVDFEIEDALDKLEKLRIVEKAGGRYRPYPLPKALEMLDYTWDNYFKYNNPEPEQAPVP
jgi:hypothetical protein